MPSSRKPNRTFDALPDTVDFRDQLYIPALIRVKPQSDLAQYRSYRIPVLDQGKDGACTGFGLATVANYLIRARGGDPEADEVSAWMLYAMAKRYDEWPGEDYEGSSARGAIKGWHKHGLCAYRLWKDDSGGASFTEEMAADAIKRPLGSYFRVNHKDLVAMHAAIAEVGILYATAQVHEGWHAASKAGPVIPFEAGSIGGHAFALVGYNSEGFWIQNSWGEAWGDGGIALLTYADWLSNGTDAWVAALGAPVELAEPLASASMRSGAPRSYESRIYASLRPHIVTAKNNGLLDDKGTYGLTEEGLRSILLEQLPQKVSGWKRKRLLLYAHGGLVSQDSAVQTVANNRDGLLKAEVYPVSFIWRSDLWSTITDILKDAVSRRRDEGVLETAKDFMLDRLDDTIEPLARYLGGKALWDEMKENAAAATTQAKGAARLVAGHVKALADAKQIDEVHLAGHSAGSIFHASLAAYLAKIGVPIRSVVLLAPACTMDLFNATYRKLAESGAISSFDLYTLDDKTEQDDDCAGIYHKSLLYLVSNAFEKKAGIFGAGTPLLGLQRDAGALPAAFWRPASREWHLAPGAASKAKHHGDFDDDPTTLASALSRILGRQAGDESLAAAGFVPMPALSEQRQVRRRLDVALGR